MDLSVGHDVEEISNFPQTHSYATDPFYTRYFTSAEIAACLRFAEPRQHFAARFCAKEALLKCGELFRTMELRDIAIENDAQGKPSIVLHNERVKRLLGTGRILTSLSHTDTIASAVVLVVWPDLRPDGQ